MPYNDVNEKYIAQEVVASIRETVASASNNIKESNSIEITSSLLLRAYNCALDKDKESFDKVLADCDKLEDDYPHELKKNTLVNVLMVFALDGNQEAFDMVKSACPDDLKQRCIIRSNSELRLK